MQLHGDDALVQCLPRLAPWWNTHRMDSTGSTGTADEPAQRQSRLSLGRQLRAYRLAASKTPGDFTTAGIGSASKLSRIENGKSPVSLPDLREMCRIYGLNGMATEKLVQLARITNAEGWW